MHYDISDFIPCEICGTKAVDIHHIERRGMGGNPNADKINNLMALCRHHHDQLGDVPEMKSYLTKVHERAMNKRK